MEFNFCLYQKLINFFYEIDWCLNIMINSYYLKWMPYIELIFKKKKIYIYIYTYIHPLYFWGLNGGKLYLPTPKTYWYLDIMIKNYYQEQILYVELILKKKKKQQQQQQISSILFSFLKKKKKKPLSFWGRNGGELYPLTPKTYWYINIMIKSYYHKQTQ